MNTEGKKTISLIVFAITTIGIVIARTSPNATITGWIPAFVLLAGWGYLFSKRLINERKIGKLAVSVLCILIAGVFVTIPYHSRVVWQHDFEGSITITATGEKNEASHASEVWVSLIVDGSPLSLQRFANESWEATENGTTLFSRYGSFTVEEIRFSSLLLSFASHEWAGIVEITTPSGTQRHDLYNIGTDIYEVEILHDNDETTLFSANFFNDFIFILAIVSMAACMIVCTPMARRGT